MICNARIYPKRTRKVSKSIKSCLDRIEYRKIVTACSNKNSSIINDSRPTSGRVVVGEVVWARAIITGSAYLVEFPIRNKLVGKGHLYGKACVIRYTSPELPVMLLKSSTAETNWILTSVVVLRLGRSPTSADRFAPRFANV